MARVINFKGESVEVECLSCALVDGSVENPGAVFRSKYFDAHQDFEIPINGFIILSSVRHIQSVEEFTDEEKIDFMNVLISIRKAMRKVLNIQVVYLIQEEDTSAHFHLWIFPRYEWMEKEFGKKIQSVRPIMEYARKTMKTPDDLDNIRETIKKLSENLNQNQIIQSLISGDVNIKGF